MYLIFNFFLPRFERAAMASSILSNNAITQHTTQVTPVNSTASNSNSKSSAHLTRKRSYETALTDPVSNAIEFASTETEHIASMKPPSSSSEFMSTDSAVNTALKDYTRTISQNEPDDGENCSSDLTSKTTLETAASPVKKKYLPPKNLQNLPSVSSGSSDIQVSKM